MAAAGDLLQLTASLVDIPSVSHDETLLADEVARRLDGLRHLEVHRVGDNVVARTSLGRPQRVLLAGHLDTVPANGNDRAVLDADRCTGLGAADMKGGLAVLLELAAAVSEPVVDVTYVWYVCEEVSQRFSGLRELEGARPDLLEGDAAVLAEPTGALVEAGCQGVLKVAVRLGGARAHTARPWMGVNAVHRLAPVLATIAAYEARRPVIDGCEYREALQATSVTGGVAGNVVPDEAVVVLNHRFAPDRTRDEAFAALVALLEPVVDPALGDSITLEDHSAPAPPGLSHPLLADLVHASGTEPRAKLGWTDVSFFAARGIPAANFGPGDPSLAHTAGEWVSGSDLERVYGALHDLIAGGDR